MRREHQHDQLRLQPWMRRWVHAVAWACALSGVGWLYLHHFMVVEGEFGLERHPAERWTMVVHGAAAFAAAWVLGLVWLGHARRGVHQRSRNLASGLAVLALGGFLVLSGWAIYYLGDDQWRAWTATAHWLVGLAAIVWLPLHAALGRRSRR